MIPDWWWWLLWAWCAAAVLGLLIAAGQGVYHRLPATRRRQRAELAQRLAQAAEYDERRAYEAQTEQTWRARLDWLADRDD